MLNRPTFGGHIKWTILSDYQHISLFLVPGEFGEVNHHEVQPLAV